MLKLRDYYREGRGKEVARGQGLINWPQVAFSWPTVFLERVLLRIETF